MTSCYSSDNSTELVEYKKAEHIADNYNTAVTWQSARIKIDFT